ncbi:hypothetical protein SAMN02910451_01746 [Butyrivibrio hungatei]|uniref:Dolichyl-phosphate-mannose-protein mannosyltransferase n=1 Tax=Butyrivibrio hungatei TaxID=185008 RepID=A0A1G5E2L3_9FIRM|nr:hypothetical protein [Butyrivibrio hungatei]SCY21127.1 hypothetical protein SAMN02910451_01746 [Butyrivibrio hungatei]
MKNKRENITRIAYFAFIFIILMVFYSIYYPMVLCSPDDWRYINYWRDNALVYIGRGWNPARVLPEMLMPLMANMGFSFGRLYGISFLKSVSIGLSLGVVIFICLYIYFFSRMIRRRFALDIFQELFIATVFLLIHFWMFRSNTFRNTFLIYGGDPNTYYYYVIPFLLNCTVCFIWNTCDSSADISKWPEFVRGIWIIAIYLAVFSNMFNSIVIAVYASLRLLIYIFQSLKRKNNCLIYKNVKYECAVLVMWIYSLVAELNGGRAHSLIGAGKKGESYISRVVQTFLCSMNLFKKFNKYFLLFSFLLVAYSVLAIIIHKGKTTDVKCGNAVNWPGIYIFVLVFLGLVYLYQLLLGGFVGSLYIERTMVSNTYLISIVLIDIFALIYIVVNNKNIMVFAPIVTMIMVSMIGTPEPVFSGGYNDSQAYEKLYENYLGAVIDADNKGEAEVVLVAPDWNPISEENIDYYELLAKYMSSTLYKYGMTGKLIKISF